MRSGLGLLAVSSVFGLATWPQPISAECGDGNQEEPAEECDDGNPSDGDGCSAACLLECEEIGRAATDHTCLHVAHGPYDQASAQEYPPGFIFGSIDTPHTHYTVSLPESAGTARSAVTYWPAAKGAFAFYTKGSVPLEVFTEAAEPVALRLEHAISACQDPASLTWVRVFNLSDQAPYYVVFGQTDETEVVVLVERLDGFKSAHYADLDGDGWGDDSTALFSWCPVPRRTEQGGDCDDQLDTTYPAALELCNGVDDDCNSETPDVCTNDAGLDDAGSDAGPDRDGGLAVDAGLEPDAGVFDAGTADAASPITDAGARDSAVNETPRPRSDASMTADPSESADAGVAESPRSGDSSGCQLGAAGSTMSQWFLLLPLLFLVRRRLAARGTR